MSFRQVAFNVTQATSGVGLLTGHVWQSGLTAATNVIFDPFEASGRFYIMGSNWSQWRLKRASARYVPIVSGSGVVGTPAGGTTTPTYAVREFAFGFTGDPGYGPNNYDSILSIGGRTCSTSRGFTYNLSQASRKWLYTTAVASPDADELRITACGQFCASFFDTSTTAAATYGVIILDYTVQFRNPVNNSVPVGRPLLVSHESSDADDEKSDDDSKSSEYIIVKGQRYRRV
jgi:hypothetical protein